jgi:hypothetical protein
VNDEEENEEEEEEKEGKRGRRGRGEDTSHNLGKMSLRLPTTVRHTIGAAI